MNEETRLAHKVGFWSASLSTLLVAVTTVATLIAVAGVYDTTLLQYTLWLILAPTLVVLMLSIHNSPIATHKKLLSGAGVAFMLVYAVAVSINYFIQLTAIRLSSTTGSTSGIELFSLSMTNFYSVAWSLEVLSYGFQGLALLFLAPLFSGTKIKNATRWLLLINGINAVFGLFIYPLNLNVLIFVSSFFLWSLLFPITTALIAIDFRQAIGKT